MKLWQKEGVDTLQSIETFTVGSDREFDLLLAGCDIIGTLAHIQMLQECGLLPLDEFELADRELRLLLSDVANGSMRIDDNCEDIHSQIEMMLTQRIGSVGKKIHTGRSRNDQIAVDIKLYLRNEIILIKHQVRELFDILQSLSEHYKNELMPGYTHLQIAMPSSFGLWFGAYAEALVDDMQLLGSVYQMVNKNPLGSAAGFGSSLPLNRMRTTELLGFEDLHYNSIYAQMSRGKTERFVANGLANLAATLAKLSMDICLYSGQDYQFLELPTEYTTGSSIMPHKKNPDVFELIRGKCNRIQALPNEFALLLTNLPAGYHRELQLTKEMLFPAIASFRQCLAMAIVAIPGIRISRNLLSSEKYTPLFTVEKVNELITGGIPFREAYQQIGAQVASGNFIFSGRELKHTHEGSISNLCTEQIRENFRRAAAQIPDQIFNGF
jgi:argininosuccinate lyase